MPRPALNLEKRIVWKLKALLTSSKKLRLRVKAKADTQYRKQREKSQGKKTSFMAEWKELDCSQKKLNNTESLILAQDERWRSA